MSYTTDILTTESAFESLENEWQPLLEASATNEVFQTFSFLHTCWKSFAPGKLSLITVRDDLGKLLALAPLFLQEAAGTTSAQLLGCSTVSDYLDLLVDATLQNKLYPVLLQKIEELPWDTLAWCSLPEASPTRTWLKNFFSGEQVREMQQDVCPQIMLPASWETYLASIDRKQRHEIRRKERRLLAFEHSFEEIEQPSTLDIADFIRLHKASSQNKRAFWDDTHLAFFSQILPSLGKQRWLKLFFLKVKGVRAASMLIFDYNNAFQLYNSGFLLSEFRELSVGSLLTAHTIKRAIQEKRTMYDFLRGNEEYKFRYTAQAKPIFDITISRDRQSAK